MVRQCATLDELKGAIAEAGDKLVVIDFFAPCGPCRQIAPKVEQWAAELADTVVFLKVDVDENEAAGTAYEIQAMPTFVLVKGGAVVATVIGADIGKIKAKIEENK